jgi:hypothetical protein
LLYNLCNFDAMMAAVKLVQAVFVIPPRVHLLDITGPAHVFYEAADYGAPIKLHFCNIHAEETAFKAAAACFYQTW